MASSPAPIVAPTAIIGPSGIGKAKLARNVFEHPRVCEYFGDDRLFFSCEGAEDPDEVLLRLATKLRLQRAEDTPLWPAVIDEICSRQRTLLVLNNFESIWSPEKGSSCEAAEIFLEQLAILDELTLLVVISGDRLPGNITWANAETAELDVISSTAKTELNHLLRHVLASSTAPTSIAAPIGIEAPIGIVGPGGIGKTTLALKVLHHPRVREYYGEDRLFVSCEGAASSDEVLTKLACKLGIQRNEHAPLWPAVVNAIRSRQRILVLLDNFESIWSPTDDALREAAEAFLAQLAVLDELTLLVTTRGNRLPNNLTWANAETAELDTLSSTAARQTFTDLACLKSQVLESEPEQAALTNLLREIDFVPLAITLLARLDDPPSNLLREWYEYHTDVLEADHHDGSRRELSVTVSIKISLAHLPAESEHAQPRGLLSVCGQLPAGLFPIVSAQLGHVIADLESAAEELLCHSLVYLGGRGQLKMLSPVRHYVSANLQVTTSTQSALDEIYLCMADNSPSPSCGKLEDKSAYDMEIPNILNIFTEMLNRSNATHTAAMINFTTYCTNRQYTCLSLLQKLEPHLDHGDTVFLYFLLATASQWLISGQLATAIEPFELAGDLLAEMGEVRAEGAARYGLLLVYCSLGRMDDAMQIRKRYLSLIRQSLGVSDQDIPTSDEDILMTEQRLRSSRQAYLQAGDGSTVQELSDTILKIVRDRGNAEAYGEELNLCMAFCEQMQSDQEWPVHLRIQMARLFSESGDLDGAEGQLLDAWEIATGSRNPDILATVTSAIGLLRLVQNRFTEASELFLAASLRHREGGSLQWAGVLRFAAEQAGELADLNVRFDMPT